MAELMATNSNADGSDGGGKFSGDSQCDGSWSGDRGGDWRDVIWCGVRESS